MLLPKELQLENPLWRYALLVYPRLQTELLALQTDGARVNHLLAALWLGSKDLLISTELISLSERWYQEHSFPMRLLRLAVSAQRETVPELEQSYQTFKSAELAMEKIELGLIYLELNSLSESSSDATRINLERILSLTYPSSFQEKTKQLLVAFTQPL